MRTAARYNLLLVCLALAACSPSDDAPKTQLLKQERDALEQAKSLDQAQQQLLEQQRRAIEQQQQ